MLYLLHGLSDDDTIWLRRTSIERYVAPLGLAVVMPQVHRSFYADEAHGGRYWTFLTEELPALVGSFFRLSDRREDTFVAGLSMGGYGALKWALRQPGAVRRRGEPVRRPRHGPACSSRRARGRRTRDMFDPRLRRPARSRARDDDLLWLLDRADAADAAARCTSCCGTEDPLLRRQRRASDDACARPGVPVTVDFGPGEHEWGYWDAQIQDVLAWLPLDPPDARPATS